jgi:hypothetical protein
MFSDKDLPATKEVVGMWKERQEDLGDTPKSNPPSQDTN